MPEEIKKSQKKEKNYDIEPGHLPQAEVIYSPAQVIGMKDAGADGFQFVPLTQSEGYISAEYAYLYPPGIPMLVPGNGSQRRSGNIFNGIWKEHMRYRE